MQRRSFIKKTSFTTASVLLVSGLLSSRGYATGTTADADTCCPGGGGSKTVMVTVEINKEDVESDFTTDIQRNVRTPAEEGSSAVWEKTSVKGKVTGGTESLPATITDLPMTLSGAISACGATKSGIFSITGSEHIVETLELTIEYKRTNGPTVHTYRKVVNVPFSGNIVVTSPDNPEVSGSAPCVEKAEDGTTECPWSVSSTGTYRMNFNATVTIPAYTLDDSNVVGGGGPGVTVNVPQKQTSIAFEDQGDFTESWNGVEICSRE